MTQTVPRRLTGSDGLGRYYTKAAVGQLLISQMAHLTPSRVLDLGSGGGSLSFAASKRWLGAELLTVDVDAKAQARIKKALAETSARHLHIRADALSADLYQRVVDPRGPIDVAVCNPPFFVPRWRSQYSEIVESAGFSSALAVTPDVDAALLFFAQNLRLTQSLATVGMIFPDCMISAARYRKFREELLRKFCVESVVQLPRSSFVGTEAQGYVVVVRKGAGSTRAVTISKLIGGVLAPSLEVDRAGAEQRLDYDFHRARCMASEKKTMTISEMNGVVCRGNLDSAQARRCAFPVLHTTDLDDSHRGFWCDFSQFGSTESLAKRAGVRYASPGDIVLARVGRNLERKVVGVSSGYPVLSDCVYSIRVEAKFRKGLLRFLASVEGAESLSSCAYGVGARQLTKAALISMSVMV